MKYKENKVKTNVPFKATEYWMRSVVGAPQTGKSYYSVGLRYSDYYSRQERLLTWVYMRLQVLLQIQIWGLT